MFFKAPSLRNIEKKGPCFLNSTAKTLDNAVIKMAKHQLGSELRKQQVIEMETFLKSLTGELPVDYVKKRQLANEGKDRNTHQNRQKKPV